MNISRRIVFILTFLTLFSNISFPIDSHKHSRVQGFFVNNSPEPNSGSSQKIEKSKYEEFFINLPEAKKWMEEAGFNDQREFVKWLSDLLEMCIEAAIQKIIISKELSQEFKDEFTKSINGDGNFKIRHTPIVFKKDLKCLGAFIDGAFNGNSINIQLNATITRTGLPERHLKRIIDYLAKKLAQTKPGEEPNFGDAWEKLNDFI